MIIYETYKLTYKLTKLKSILPKMPKLANKTQRNIVYTIYYTYKHLYSKCFVS